MIVIDLTYLPKGPGIYKIVCKPNGRVYIGSSQNVRMRMHQHIHHLLKGTHQNRHLQRAFNKYGIEEFSFELIEKCSVDDLLTKEEYYINKYNSTYHLKGFNIIENPTEGGRGRTLSEETKRKLSERFSGKGHPNYGKRLPEETRMKISMAQKGKKKMSEEAKRRISEASRGSKNGAAKLTEQDVINIKLLIASGKVTQASIARLYNVDPTLILNIKKGKLWKHVVVDENTTSDELDDLINKCLEISKKVAEEARLANSVKHRGENGSKTRLTEEDVKDIKKMFKEGKTAKEISAKYKMSLSALYAIKHGKNWSHVSA